VKNKQLKCIYDIIPFALLNFLAFRAKPSLPRHYHFTAVYACILQVSYKEVFPGRPYILANLIEIRGNKRKGRKIRLCK